MRHRRWSRRKLTARQKRLYELVERAELRMDVLSVGLAERLRRISELAQLKQILDIVATDLVPSLKELERLTNELHPPRARTRKNPKQRTNAKKSAKNTRKENSK